MQFVDYLILIISILVITIVCIYNSKEDGLHALTGQTLEQEKNKKMQGAELFLTRAMIFLSTFFAICVIWSNSIDRLF